MRRPIATCVSLGLLLTAIAGCADATPSVTSTPPPSISAVQLYAEREANATRYDQQYRGKWVTITGIVGEIDDGEVRLVVDLEEWRGLGNLFLDYISLSDLPDEEQAKVNKGQEVTATCEVGDYVFGEISLKKCGSLEPAAVVTTTVASMDGDTPQPSPTPTPKLTGSPTLQPDPTPTVAPSTTETLATPTPESTTRPTPTPGPTLTPTSTPTPTLPPTPEPGFGDGTWIVGDEIEAGLYAAGPGLDGCYWERRSGFSGNFDDTIANDFGNPRPIVHIVSTDKGFTSERCGRWQPLADVLTALTTIPDGTWSIPEEVTAGTYSAPGGESCYWERLSGFSGDFDDTIANDLGGGRAIVEIAPTDAGFHTSDCGEWERVN